MSSRDQDVDLLIAIDISTRSNDELTFAYQIQPDFFPRSSDGDCGNDTVSYRSLRHGTPSASAAVVVFRVLAIILSRTWMIGVISRLPMMLDRVKSREEEKGSQMTATSSQVEWEKNGKIAGRTTRLHPTLQEMVKWALSHATFQNCSGHRKKRAAKNMEIS